MKIASIENPVRADWFFEQGLRLDASPYLSGAIEARKRLQALPNTMRLDSVTAGHNGGIYNGPKFIRTYLTDPEHSVPFLGSTDMLEADFSFLPRLRRETADRLRYLKVEPGMSLISCSGTIGRMSYVRPDMASFWSSQDVMKVQANPHRIAPGYLYTFLRSRFGVPMIVASAYGGIIQHIEPNHLVDLPVPRFDSRLEQKIHDLVEGAARLRAASQAALVAATDDFFQSVGLPELIDQRWHDQERDLGFQVTDLGSQSIRALNFSPRARRIVAKLSSVEHRRLGDICEGGLLSRGVRFKRIDSDAEFGVTLVGQRQAFWVTPEGRRVSAGTLPPQVFAEDETILMAARGTLGENEVYCRAAFITGSWLDNAYSEDFLRIVSGTREISGAYLFAFLRSDAAFRVFRSLSTGGKQQDIHEGLRRKVPIPLAPKADRTRISERIRQAYRDRDHADVLENQALALLTHAIEGASA
ncbi:methylation-associated defense system restriction endonuclease subunit S MAD5 [Arthrobacter sp. B6]|uniref:methylation-associated defense system restriction endonuclease subunit S MAD5 n=1 Tax=Arthrobacter sp. B6 TaxID=1570137 RepID=UPI0008303406|nr:restriction endonuclease subunit S [Arthrobacter sp. B6]